MNNEKQTSVEWLFLMLNNPNRDQQFANKLLEKAKEIEKEQHRNNLIDFVKWIKLMETDSKEIVDMFIKYSNNK